MAMYGWWGTRDLPAGEGGKWRGDLTDHIGIITVRNVGNVTRSFRDLCAGVNAGEWATWRSMGSAVDPDGKVGFIIHLHACFALVAATSVSAAYVVRTVNLNPDSVVLPICVLEDKGRAQTFTIPFMSHGSIQQLRPPDSSFRPSSASSSRSFSLDGLFISVIFFIKHSDRSIFRAESHVIKTESKGSNLISLVRDLGSIPLHVAMPRARIQPVRDKIVGIRPWENLVCSARRLYPARSLTFPFGL
ncbi:hypothetical protein NL676_032652 [Syzygium grande]|nr:hypothetical protein NL676_032652 [Syzygium grande]